MNGSALEAFLARIYVDAQARERFARNPREEARRAGLAEEDCEALVRCAKTEHVALAMAAQSFAIKRRNKNNVQRRRATAVGRVFVAAQRAIRMLLRRG